MLRDQFKIQPFGYAQGPVQKSKVILTVVPIPRVLITTNESEFFFMLGKPIPAPNPISLTFGEAVEKPSSIARSMSTIPGP